jgi:hypothetical protein
MALVSFPNSDPVSVTTEIGVKAPRSSSPDPVFTEKPAAELVFFKATDTAQQRLGKASEILDAAITTLEDRAASRDVSQERSMARTVEIFNAIGNCQLSELDGWMFMVALKIARSCQGAINPDDFIDLAGYSALAGECAINSS